MAFSPATRIRALCGAFALTLAPSIVHAQRTGFATDRFDPTPAGDLFFQSHFPSYSATGPVLPRFALTTGYANRPLVGIVVQPSGATNDISVIEHSLVTHAQINMHFAQRLGLDASLPIYWFQSGVTDPSYPVHAASSPVLGDLRLGARLRIAGHADRDPASLHIGTAAHMGFLNLASSQNGTTDEAIRVRLFIAGAGTAGPFVWSAMVGVHSRQSLDTPYARVRSELYGNAAIGLSFARRMFLIGVEGNFATQLDAPFQTGRNFAEVYGVIRARLANDALQIGLGAGPGITETPGTPALRAMFTLAVTPQLEASTERSLPPPEASAPTANSNGTAPQGARPESASSTSPGTSQQISTSSAGTEPHGATATPTSEARAVETGRTTSDPGSRPRVTLRRFCDVPNSTECSVGDADSDGIYEPLDQCPDTAVGPHPDPERTGCPDGDADGDEVTDHSDQCRDEPIGTVPDPSRLGCPRPDADGDRIADAEDHCPDRPGAPHTDPILNGCPGLVQLDANILRILQPIFFAVGRDTIEARSTPVLEGVREALMARTEIRTMRIEGHTDDNGNAEINVDLSHRRAAAVVRWLIEHGVAPARLHSEGFGSSRPRVAITPQMRRRQRDDARGVNRRVEFEIVRDEPAEEATAPAAQSGTTQPAAGPPHE